VIVRFPSSPSDAGDGASGDKGLRPGKITAVDPALPHRSRCHRSGLIGAFGLTGVVMGQTGIVSGLTGVVMGLTGVVTGLTGIVSGPTGVASGQSGIVSGLTGVSALSRGK
jgi:hypothetical protein